MWHGVGWKYAEGVNDCWNNTIKAKLEKYAFSELPIYGFDLLKS